MKYLKAIILLISIQCIFCSVSANSDQSPVLNNEEAFKHQVSYLAEHDEILNSLSRPSIHAVQPTNKKEKCLIMTGSNPSDSDYSLFWDGSCRDDYAYGLGREFESTSTSNKEQIGFYIHGVPSEYYFVLDKLNNIYLQMDVDGFGVKTIITNSEKDLSLFEETGRISQKYLLSDVSDYKPILTKYTSPFDAKIIYYKGYTNHTYILADYSTDEFSHRNYQFNITNNKNEYHGYGFTTTRTNGVFAAEMLNNNIHRRVTLPHSYFTKIANITDEINQTVITAIKSKGKASELRYKYILKVCDPSFQVDFMPMEKYKEICNEHNHIKALNKKVFAKQRKINHAIQLKLETIATEKRIESERRQLKSAQNKKTIPLQQSSSSYLRKPNVSLRDNSSNLQQLIDYKNNFNRYRIKPKSIGYSSSFGSNYQYDLSKQKDRIRYRYDPAAKLRDRFNLNPLKNVEQGIGQYGGGYLK